MSPPISAGALRILVVDDSDDDALLVVRALRQAQYGVTWKRAETPEMLRLLLREGRWDVLFADYSLPEFSAVAALDAVRESGQDLPFIVLSGVVNEEIAVKVMRAGAHDFLAKDKLNRLVPAVEREIRDATLRRKRARAEAGVRLLTESGAMLMASLDYADTLDRASHVALPSFADHCDIDLCDEAGLMRRVASADAEPTTSADVGDRMAVASPEATQVLESLTVPLRLRGNSVGAINFVMTASGRRYSGDDVPLAEELARRIAVALDNSLLFAAEQRAHAAADEALHARDNFLAIASHELRTPLTVVKCAAELLLGDFDDGSVAPDEAVRRLTMIKTMCDRLNLLMADLLDVSRLRTGVFQLRLEPLDLALLTREVVAQYHLLLGAHYPLTFTGPEMPMRMNIDRLRVQQALANVLENAIKYSPAAGQIDVRLSAVEAGVLLTVADDGIGLPPEAASRIFEPFERGANAQRRQLPGMGLGLFIARQIVAQHGGAIWADSAGESRGTLVSIWLPNPAQQPLSAPPSPPTALLLQAAQASNRTLLQQTGW